MDPPKPIDPNQMISENIIRSGRSRLLENYELIKEIMEQLASGKTEISTLTEIWKAFYEAFGSTEIYLGRDYSPLQRHYFIYDGRTWCGTSKSQYSKYIDRHGRREVQFFNIKLPLDGFLPTVTYQDNENRRSLMMTQETSSFVYDIVSRIVPFEDYEIIANYKVDESRVELYFWEMPQRKRCITVKYELGPFEYYINTKTYTKSQLQDILNHPKND